MQTNKTKSTEIVWEVYMDDGWRPESVLHWYWARVSPVNTCHLSDAFGIRVGDSGDERTIGP